MASPVEMTIPEFHGALKAQGVKGREDFAFKCVICGTVQSGRDFMRALDKPSFDDVERYVGFSCIGRFTDAGPWKKGSKPGAGCDWTLGGLLTLHKLTVIDEDGKRYPRFELATPEEAQAHAAAEARLVGRAA